MSQLWSKTARRLLSRIHKTGLEQELNRAEITGKLAVPEIAPAARALAAEGIVLLKNEQKTLPITKETRVAVFGRSAVDYFTVGYGSGGDVIAPYRRNLMEGLLEHGVKIDGPMAALYETWCSLPKNVPDEGYWAHWPMSNPEMPLKSEDVAAAARRCDMALVVIGRAAGEARENVLKPGSYYLTEKEKAMLDQVATFFHRICLVMDCGNVIDMSWVQDYAQKLTAIVYAWQGGMESGTALADVLTGAVNPSGKLTDTIAVKYEDYPSSQSFGGQAFNAYTEDIYVGYRYFETFAPERVLYPFGFGLSYTRFRLTSQAAVNGNQITVTTEVENVGDADGREVVQIYVDLPCGTCLASTFDPEAVEALYALLGREMIAQGTQVILGPGMNIHRNPLCGRNFEYYSEDPLVTGKIAAAMVRGVQSQGVSACPKHFACNNQETNRNECDSRLSQRAQREIYLKGFEICLRESDPWCLMTSYNLVNGVWSHYHYELATDILREEWGYQGLTITDWWMHPAASPEFPNIRDDAYRIRAQVDVLMPGEIQERTLPASLEDPNGVTRAEAQRCALNVIRFILKLK